MTRRRGIALLAGACACALAGACRGLPGGGGRTSGPATLTDQWPADPDGYDDVVEEWTRTGRIVQGYDRVVEVSATFKSPEWRAAYVERRARLDALPPDEVRALTEAEQAAHAEHYEVEILLSTYRYEDNDLQKNLSSRWRVALVDDEGNEIRPVSIQRDRRSRELLKRFFPDLQSFHTPYVARFPRTAQLLGDGAERFTLKLSGPYGQLELVWTAR